jgi:hypothetical protein
VHVSWIRLNAAMPSNTSSPAAPSPSAPSPSAPKPRPAYAMRPLGPGPEMIPSDYVASTFGYAPGRHFRRKVAPLQNLTPVLVGGRWHFRREDVEKVRQGMNARVFGAATAATLSAQGHDARPDVPLSRATEVARHFGYSTVDHFIRVVAPRLGLSAIRVGPRIYFDTAAAAAVAARTPGTLSFNKPEAEAKG